MNILGWLIAIPSLVYLLSTTGQITVFFDFGFYVVIPLIIYGLSMVSFGKEDTVRSLSNLRYLVLGNANHCKRLSRIYKTQVVFSFVAGLVVFLAGLIVALADVEQVSVVFASISLHLVAPFFSLILTGFVYYPLYKKFQE